MPKTQKREIKTGLGFSGEHLTSQTRRMAAENVPNADSCQLRPTASPQLCSYLCVTRLCREYRQWMEKVQKRAVYQQLTSPASYFSHKVRDGVCFPLETTEKEAVRQTAGEGLRDKPHPEWIPEVLEG